MTQHYSSANTSVNSKRVPRLFKALTWQPGTVNLDYGGGKWDTASDYLWTKGVINRIYDPYNRTPEHNARVLSATAYNTATISNVLCVIAEPDVRRAVVDDALAHLQTGGTLYISIYEGNHSGHGHQSEPDCWQNNQPVEFYAQELADLNPVIKNKIIRIVKRG